VYSRNPAASEFVQVTATATAASNASVTATVRQYVRTNSLLQNPDLDDVAPLLIDGCMSNVTGTPDLVPKAAGEVSVATGQAADCLEQGSLGYNGGVEAYGAFTGDIWDHTFPKSRTEMKAIADAEVAAGVADADRTVIWVSSTNPYHKSWGSPSHPVILIFDAAANCPNINGGPTVYGMVFFDSDCTANGFGGFTTYGGIVVNGDIDGMNANVDMSHWTHAGAPVAPDHFKVSVAPIVMGSWHDF
jgi:hypothetical protein